MRLDKYLKVSRLIKRRTVAKEVCDAGRTTINGRPAKAGSEVAVGDVLMIRYGQKTVEVRVLSLLENPTKAQSLELYESIGEVRPEDLDM